MPFLLVFLSTCNQPFCGSGDTCVLMAVLVGLCLITTEVLPCKLVLGMVLAPDMSSWLEKPTCQDLQVASTSRQHRVLALDHRAVSKWILTTTSFSEAGTVFSRLAPG